MSARPFGILTAAVVAAASCSHGRSGGPLLGGGAPTAETRDELLVATGDAVWRGDLATAHAMLTRLADRERAVADSALDFWSEMLALLRCEPLKRIPRTGPQDRELSDPWDGLRRLAQIERVRLGREGKGPLPSAHGGHLKTGIAEEQMVWPVEKELWTDELPMPAVANRCADSAPTGEERARMSVPATEPEVALVSSAARLLPGEHPAKALLFVQAAVLDIGRGDANAGNAPLARLEQLGPRPFTPDERDTIVLASALAAVADPFAKPDVLLSKGRAALALKINAPARRALSLLLAERLESAGLAQEASATLGPPPHGDDEIGRYIAFKQMEAHARASRLGPLLAEAREVLNRRPHAEVERDPASTAIMDIALRTLLASPVSDETLEVLESLGPPRERLGRAEEFALMALDTGAFRSAMATFVWLYENDKEPNRQLQNLARASVAAARAADRAEFARTFRLLAGQEDRLDPSDKKREKTGDKKGEKGDRKGERKPGDKAADRTEKVAAKRAETPAEKLERQALEGRLIASAESDKVRDKRRATRSENWQRALLVVARDALPALVENDDQANLTTLVDTLKRHLGDGGKGPVDEELTTLYRAASAHLKTGARAYAETIGAERRPILLGDVLIGRKYDVPAPNIDLSSALDEVGPLVFVPRRGNDASSASIQRWPGRFGVAWNGRRS